MFDKGNAVVGKLVNLFQMTIVSDRLDTKHERKSETTITIEIYACVYELL